MNRFPIELSLIPLVILVVTASIGMLLLIGLIIAGEPKSVFRRLQAGQEYNETEKGALGCGAAVAFAGVMGLINYGLSYPLWAFTPVGRWYDAWAQWGLSHGWEGALGPLLGALMCQWVWIPLAGHFLAKQLRARTPRLSRRAAPSRRSPRRPSGRP